MSPSGRKVVVTRHPSWCRHPRRATSFRSATSCKWECPPSGALTCESCRCPHWRAGAAMGEHFVAPPTVADIQHGAFGTIILGRPRTPNRQVVCVKPCGRQSAGPIRDCLATAEEHQMSGLHGRDMTWHSQAVSWSIVGDPVPVLRTRRVIRGSQFSARIRDHKNQTVLQTPRARALT